MAYPKITSQNYNNLGGINEKASEYTTQRTQFLELFNVDFKVPNALTKRDGSTQLLSVGTSGAITNMFEYIKNDGSSYIFASTDVGLFEKTGGTLTLGFSSSNQFDFLTYDDKMWASNGETFVNYNSSDFLLFAMPPLTFGSTTSLIGASLGGWSGLLSAVVYAFSGVKSNGEEFPLYNAYRSVSNLITEYPNISYSGPRGQNGASAVVVNINYPAIGGGDGGASYGLTALDLQSLKVYRAGVTSNIASATFSNPFAFGKFVFDTIPLSNFYFFTTIPFGTATLIDSNGETLILSNDTYESNYEHPYWFHLRNSVNSSFAVGVSFVYAPNFLELYNNSLFMSGFSNQPSRVWFSEIGEPETVFPENFIDVKTDDGDKITGVKSYLDQHLIFKEKSFHRLTGDDSTNYTLVEVTSEFGCLNNYTILEAENILYFLDAKGIVKYNGTSWILQSYPIENTINRMNIEAAKTQAFAVHKKQDNQIWFAIPLDDSEENNIILVYDYVLNAWTFFDGLNASSFAVMKGDLDRRKVHFGSYSGMIHNFDPELNGDNGQAITCRMLTRFEAPQGQNIEKMYRRLFSDIQTDESASTIIDVTGYKNYNSTSGVLSLTLNQGTFQQKKEFGVSAKSMAFRFEHSSENDNFQFNGYGVATRYLRDE